MVPNAKLSVVRERVAKEMSVVRGTGERYRLVLRPGIDDGVYTIAEATSCRIEINAVEIIADGVQRMTTLWKGLCRTEIERAAIGRKDWVGLVDGVLLQNRRKNQLIFLNIVDLQIGGFVEDLDAVTVSTMEQLSRGVRRIGNVTARRMPIRIDTQAKGLVGFSIVSSKRPIMMTQ